MALQAVKAAGEEDILFGLYDTDGILRFTGRDREACIAYAELFGLTASADGAGFSLIALPEQSTVLQTNRRKKRRLVANSN